MAPARIEKSSDILNTGRADRDGDGFVSQFELLSYVVPAVHDKVESQQTPQIRPLRASSINLFPVTRSIAVKDAAVAPKVKKAAIALAPARIEKSSDILNVAIEGAASGALQGLAFVRLVSDKRDADMVWYGASGVVEHVVGGKVAEKVGPREIAAVLTKWAVLKWLRENADPVPVVASLPRGNGRYKVGAQVDVRLSGAKYPFLTLFNLPPNGRVEFFIPALNKADEANQNWLGRTIRESFRVTDPPYGAEHLVAIFSREILTDLHTALRTMKSAATAKALRLVVEKALRGRKYQAGILNIYTGNDG